MNKKERNSILVVVMVILAGLFIINSSIPQQSVLPTESQMIYENRFDQYVAPYTHSYYNIIWDEDHFVTYNHPRYSASADWRQSYSSHMTGYGTGGQYHIPSTLINVTYTFQFRLNPVENMVEQYRKSPIMWFGYDWDRYFYGWEYSPFMWFNYDILKDEVSVVFGGVYDDRSNNRHYTFQFQSWEVPLGKYSDFEDFTTMTIWMDLQKDAIYKVMIGNLDVPFPVGYEDGMFIQVDRYRSSLERGLRMGYRVGHLQPSWSISVDNFEVYTGFFVPEGNNGGIIPPIIDWWSELLEGNLLLWLLVLLIASVLTYYLLRKRKKRKGGGATKKRRKRKVK
jgi:hypothetical protein